MVMLECWSMLHLISPINYNDIFVFTLWYCGPLQWSLSRYMAQTASQRNLDLENWDVDQLGVNSCLFRGEKDLIFVTVLQDLFSKWSENNCGRRFSDIQGSVSLTAPVVTVASLVFGSPPWCMTAHHCTRVKIPGNGLREGHTVSVCVHRPKSAQTAQSPQPRISIAVQRLDLQRNNADDSDNVRGQIVISLISRDRGGSGSGPVNTDAPALIPQDPNELPEG